jgi:hypothetical protein
MDLQQMRRRVLAVSCAAAALAAGPAVAQDTTDGWNSPRAMELVARTQARRQQTQTDTGLVDYQADARGYIYFYLDRRDIDERTLVKTDQVALEVFWRAPAFSKQRIVGLRDERRLPTNIRYHEDHLTVVQDNFGDLIRLGDGDEVRDVLHPAAASGPGVYDYRLADSSTIRAAGLPEPVTVYQIEVRPRDLSQPAMVGSLFVDRRGGDIVRLAFTFTAASYVDRQLDYINVQLENGLFRGRFWLPNQQRLELRRQVPELGFPAGGVIRGTMRIGNYRFNQNLPTSLFAGRKVVSVPVAQRRAFSFEDPIDQELREEGLGPQVELGEIRRQAAELIRGRMLSGLPATRLDVPGASAVLRYNRAEGLAAGFGGRTHPSEQVTLGGWGGLATGPMHPFGAVEAVQLRPGTRLEARAFLNRAGDMGLPAISGAMNSLTGLIAGRDYSDPYYASGVEAGTERRLGGGWTLGLQARGEDQRSARRTTTFSLKGAEHFRPVAPVDEGFFVGGAARVSRAAPSGVALGWSLAAGVDGGSLGAVEANRRFVRPRAELGLVRRWNRHHAELQLDGSAGAALGELPRQGLFLLGGRGTVPGQPFRAFGGDRFALLRATASADLAGPLVRARAFAAGGWTGVGDPGGVALADWGARTAQDGRFGVGAGLGLFFDILRVDVARGVGPDGQWEVVVEANPSFWDFL